MPAPLQNVAISVWGIRQRRNRYGREFWSKLEWLKQTEWWTEDQIRDYQDLQTQQIVAHAYRTVPFYKSHWADADIDPLQVKSLDDLPRLPILTKDIVRANQNAIVSSEFAGSKSLHVGHTGGTTGTPLTITMTNEAMQYQWAVWWRHRARFGLQLGDKFLNFGNKLAFDRPPFWRINRAINQWYLSTDLLTPDHLGVVAQWLQGEEFKFFSGNPSRMFILADYLRNNNLILNHPPKYIVGGSDTLIPAFESLFEEVFGAKVTDQYGFAEACGNLSRCEYGKYHLDAEFGAMELLPSDAPDPRIQRMVFTGFANPVMPLIRYEIGDLARTSNEVCECGRQSVTVDAIEGRTEDYIRTPDGRRIRAMSTVFMLAPGIRLAQVRQRAIDELEILMVPGDSYSDADRKIIHDELRRRVGEVMSITFTLTDSITRSSNGKYRAVVSDLPPASPEEAALHQAVE